MTFLTLLHTAPSAPPVVVSGELGARWPLRGRRHPRYSRPKLHPEEIARQQRMVQEYLDSLEQKAPPEIQRPAPKFTAALARAAADVQLTTVIRIAAAVQDRERAAEELRQRRLRLVLLLALD